MTEETDIQRAICDYLAYKKMFFWRNNNIPIFSEGRFRAMPKYSKRGVPDILVILQGGKFLGIEVKTSAGRQSDSQKDFERDVVAVGGEYLTARSVDDVMHRFGD